MVEIILPAWFVYATVYFGLGLIVTFSILIVEGEGINFKSQWVTNLFLFILWPFTVIMIVMLFMVSMIHKLTNR